MVLDQNSNYFRLRDTSTTPLIKNSIEILVGQAVFKLWNSQNIVLINNSRPLGLLKGSVNPETVKKYCTLLGLSNYNSDVYKSIHFWNGN